MSGNFVPYQLRLGKGIDRRLFCHTILKCADYLEIDNATYCSMPGPFAEDFKAIYNILKVRNFIAIENSRDTVKRQQFNWEFDKANFDFRPSENFVIELDTIECDSLIIWLDYTTPNGLGEQLEEASNVLSKLQCKDIFRITMNANPDSLDEAGDSRPVQEKAADRKAKFLSRLGLEIDLPDDYTYYSSKGFYKVLIKAFKHFANDALDGEESYFHPILTTTYQDSAHRMVTITGIVLEENKWQDFLEKTKIEELNYTTLTWDSDPIKIETPSLSDKERLFIDARADLEWSPEKIFQDLGFKISRGNEDKQIDSIRKYLDFRMHIPYITKTAPGF